MRFSQAVCALSSLAGACEAFRFTVWLGDKCTISGTGTNASDQQLLIIPQAVNDEGCMKYELMEYGYDQSLLIYPEAKDANSSYLTFFLTDDCGGDPLFISPPASTLRERPVAGCSNYAAAGIVTMSYKVV